MATSRLAEALLVLAIGTGLAASARAGDDPLARPEFDQDITLSMQGEAITRVYDAIGSLAHVPFELAFDESEPALKVTFKAENMGVRAILSSLAKTYGLEYGGAGSTIVVVRKGQLPTEKRRTVGSWPPGVPQYALTFSIRKGDFVFSKPYVTTGLKQEVTMKQRLQVQGADGKSRDTLMQVDVRPQKETAGGLELSALWSVQEETAKIAASGETLLFTTPQGVQVFLNWTRLTP